MADHQINVTNFRIETRMYTMPRIQLRDRRSAAHPNLHWVFQRHLEMVLYGRSDGGSTGAVWKLLNQAGLGRTTLAINKEAVQSAIITQEEFTAILTAFKAGLVGDMIDPCSVNKIRSTAILPVSAAAAIVRGYGRSETSMEWLRVFGQNVPQAWELQEQQEEDAAAGQVDLLLQDQLDEHGFEAEDFTLAEELTQVSSFVDSAADEAKIRQYALVPLQSLKSQLAAYVAHRTAVFAARRTGGSVVNATAEHDTQCLLRFFGWMHRVGGVPDGATLDITFLARADVGTKAQGFCNWLVDTQQVRYTSVCNYLSGIVSAMNYVYFELNVDAEVLALSPTPLEQVVNLRDQAHSQIKEQNLYTPTNVKGGWITWPQVQQTRVAAMTALGALPASTTPPQRRTALKEAAMISLMSLLPPDRVGVIRRLRLGHTLQRREESGGGWRLNLSRRADGHKTSKHYGPFCSKLPSELDGVLDAYARFLTMEPGGDQAYLFSPNNTLDRPLESSAWTQAVKRAFKKHSPGAHEVSPKTLRSSFMYAPPHSLPPSARRSSCCRNVRAQKSA